MLCLDEVGWGGGTSEKDMVLSLPQTSVGGRELSHGGAVLVHCIC